MPLTETTANLLILNPATHPTSTHIEMVSKNVKNPENEENFWRSNASQTARCSLALNINMCFGNERLKLPHRHSENIETYIMNNIFGIQNYNLQIIVEPKQLFNSYYEISSPT